MERAGFRAPSVWQRAGQGEFMSDEIRDGSPAGPDQPDGDPEARDIQQSDDQTVLSTGALPDTFSPDRLVGEMVGHYRLLSVLGKGGMGVVYEAEQQTPRRKVALKIIRGRHRADEFHVRMFHREAELLGRLRHPNIAAIYESGHTDDGRHFFAMELVRGETLGAHCRSLDEPESDPSTARPADGPPATTRQPLSRTDLEHRLRLFLKICDAVSYAHQRGVIHRDLKPANILVCDQPRTATAGDESTAHGTATGPDHLETEASAPTALLSISTRTDRLPEVKVLDFGLARISDPDEEDVTMLTQAGTVKGTPAYMSPEQAGGNPDEIDLRSDIYSLGVILYEMLAGVLPLAVDDSTFLDALQIVRSMEPKSLRRASGRTRRLDADLETVVHKALDKDQQRRYQSVAEFAQDIERFLNHEPVIAAPPSASYRLRKLVRRHRTLFVSLAAVVVILIGATVVSTTQFVQAQRESARARTEARKSEQIAAFLTDMLEGVGPAVARGRDTRLLREILDHTAARVGDELHDQPEVEGTLRMVLGTTYRELGEYAAADSQLTTAQAIRRGAQGPDDPLALETTIELASLDYYQGHMARADSLFAWAGERLAATVGPEDRRTLAADAGRVLVLLYMGQLDEAVTLGENVVPLLRLHEGDASDVTQSAMYHLAQTYTDHLRHADAESLFLELIAIQDRELAPDHPNTMRTKSALGWNYRLASRHDEAEELTAGALADMRRVLGSDHPETLIAVNNLAIIYKDQQRYDEAEPLYLESLESGVRLLGETHPENLPALVNLAAFYQTQARWDDAFRLADRAVTTFTDIMPDGHLGIAFARMTRALSLVEQRRFAAAEPDLLQAHDAMSRVFQADHRHLQNVCKTLVRVYTELGRSSEAARWQTTVLPDEEGVAGS